MHDRARRSGRDLRRRLPRISRPVWRARLVSDRAGLHGGEKLPPGKSGRDQFGRRRPAIPRSGFRLDRLRRALD
uniref:Uncharacterized protein n=1 Tax=uncultured marine virus TaxID=186617 RepID=A0A0F7LAB9_9VIRU|nr:hypothetical protein [uncultured marine virus]